MKSSLAAGAAIAAVAATALAGCSYVNPITTKDNYAASDGTQLVVGDIEALNLIIVAEAEGSAATMIGTLQNSSTEDISVQLVFDGETANDVTVPAGSAARLGPDEGATEVSGTAPAAPGLMTEVTIVSDAEGGYYVDVPVMDATLPEYQPVLDAIG
mgnify:CR=1 FL=1